MTQTDLFIVKRSGAQQKCLRLICARTYVRDGKRLWAAIYRSGNWANRLLLDRDLAAFSKDTQTLFDDNGLRLTDVTTYVVNGNRRFAAICRGGDWGSRWFSALNRQHFQAT